MNTATIDKMRRKIDYVRVDQLFKNAAKANIFMVSDSYEWPSKSTDSAITLKKIINYYE